MEKERAINEIYEQNIQNYYKKSQVQNQFDKNLKKEYSKYPYIKIPHLANVYFR